MNQSGFPVQVWVIVPNDRSHKPRGFEKMLDHKVYFTEEDAVSSLKEKCLGTAASTSMFSVVEAIIMAPEYML